MTKRRKTTGISDMLFDDVDPYGAVIGQPVAAPSERFPLSVIRPDAEQPRRLLPTDLAQAVHLGQMEPTTAVAEWLKRATTDPTLAQGVRELQRLAAAIERHGLINPITIRPSELGDGRYIIVTGERRYWAHVLLALEQRQIQEGEVVQPPGQIKASLVSPGIAIRAHQIVENLMREDINVVEKAHGLWALRRELSDDARYSDAHGRHSETAESTESTESTDDAHGRHLQTEKARLVSWKQVEESLDISRQYRARIVAVLDLSHEAQELVDRHNLTERAIRPIVEKLKPYSDLQMQALRQLVAWQEAEAAGEGSGRRIVPSIEALVDNLLVDKTATATGLTARQPSLAGLDFDKFRQKVRGTLTYMQKLDETALTEFTRILDNKAGGDIVDELQALRDQIDQMLLTLAEKSDR